MTDYSPEYYVGYEDALEMVLLVIDEMKNKPDMDGQFDIHTLDELEKAIV